MLTNAKRITGHRSLPRQPCDDADKREGRQRRNARKVARQPKFSPISKPSGMPAMIASVSLVETMDRARLCRAGPPDAAAYSNGQAGCKPTDTTGSMNKSSDAPASMVNNACLIDFPFFGRHIDRRTKIDRHTFFSPSKKLMRVHCLHHHEGRRSIQLFARTTYSALTG
jgi:hypothetical protein